jgi:hypothetical protein
VLRQLTYGLVHAVYSHEQMNEDKKCKQVFSTHLEDASKKLLCATGFEPTEDQVTECLNNDKQMYCTVLAGVSHSTKACSGDSGGPLICARSPQPKEYRESNWKEHLKPDSGKFLAGVLSGSVDCTFPNVFTSVHAHKEWISETMSYKSNDEWCKNHALLQRRYCCISEVKSVEVLPNGIIYNKIVTTTRTTTTPRPSVITTDSGGVWSFWRVCKCDK